jgi:hypothetical protein
MLTDRIIGAFTFRKGVYAEVESDTTFTTTAWTIVAVVSFLVNIASHAQSNIFKWLVAAVVGTIISVVGFAIAAWVIDWVGRTVFYAEVTFDELVRTLGLAYVWQIVGVLGIFHALGILTCVTGLVQFATAILGLAAWLVAAKEALDLEWVQTAVTVVIGWIIIFVFTFITGAILGLLGVAARAVVS